MVTQYITFGWLYNRRHYGIGGYCLHTIY